MRKMTLVLHIGTEKTGTTLLQKWLYKNRRQLMEQGFFLSDKLGWENNRELVAYFRTDRDEFWDFNGFRDVQDKHDYFAGFLEDVEKEIIEAAENHHTMIITSEHFHSRLTNDVDVQNFSSFCRRNFGDHVLICYLRPQWEVRKSLYSTDLKNAETDDFSVYKDDLTSSDPYFNYSDLYKRWKRNFSSAKMDFRRYSRASFVDDDIRRDFMTAMPVPVRTEGMEFGSERENESLKKLQASAYVAVNRTTPLFSGGRVDHRNYEYKALLDEIELLKRGAIKDILSNTVYDVFKSSNNLLFRDVFFGDDVFGAPKDDAVEDETLSISEVGKIIEALVEKLIPFFQKKCLSDAEVDLVRDVALKSETGGQLSKEEAIGLMRIARKSRPSGEFIRSKLKEWAGDD